jgi:hypothetical protein
MVLGICDEKRSWRSQIDFILENEQVRTYAEDELLLILKRLRKHHQWFIDNHDYLSVNKTEHLAQIAPLYSQLSAVESMQETKCQPYQNMIERSEETQTEKDPR